MGDSCWVHTIITQVDILDIDGCSTISPEACDVDMGGIDVVVELCAGIIFIGFQVMQVRTIFVSLPKLVLDGHDQ